MKIVIITALVFFLVAVLSIELLLFGYRKLRLTERRKSRQRLKSIVQVQAQPETADLLRKNALSSVPAFNRFLLRSPLKRLERLTRQANARYPLGVYVLFSLVLVLGAVAIGSLAVDGWFLPVLAAFLLGAAPWVQLTWRKTKRMQRFQQQLPDALELVARALRAGHALTSGMRLAAEQFDDPLGPEFEVTLDEINFGVNVPDALKSLSRRVDCPDLRYFTVSVIVQREVGGNLAEIIESIARIVRERFKFKDKLRVLAAEGKFSAQILVALPFLLFLALSFINPDYLASLIEEPMGRTMCWIAGGMMVLGLFIIARMTKIRV